MMEFFYSGERGWEGFGRLEVVRPVLRRNTSGQQKDDCGMKTAEKTYASCISKAILLRNYATGCPPRLSKKPW